MRVRGLAAIAATAAVGAAMLTACGSSTNGNNAAGDGACTPISAATGTAAQGEKAAVDKAAATKAQQDWTPCRMKKATPVPNGTVHAKNNDEVSSAMPTSGASSSPSAVATPYQSGQWKMEGKLFAVLSDTEMAECSATVVHSNNKNLIWTAAHCVHSGANGHFFQEIVFVPDYNGNGATAQEMAPLGVFPAKAVETTNGWTKDGSEEETPASFVDMAVVALYPNQQGQEVEDVVGGGAEPKFDVDRTAVTSITAVGYPAADPYNGNTMYSCTADAQQFGDPAVQPAGFKNMWAIGCGMTQGSSGGGWFATIGGKQYLISDTSLGDSSAQILLGPYLSGPQGHNAQALYAEGQTFPGGPDPMPGHTGNPPAESSAPSSPAMGS